MASPQLGADPPAPAPGPLWPVMATAGGQGREDPAWPDGRDGWSWTTCQKPPPHFCLGPAEGLGSRPGEKQEFSLEGLGAGEAHRRLQMGSGSTEWRCPHLPPASSALPGVFISYPVCALEHGWLVRKPCPWRQEQVSGKREGGGGTGWGGSLALDCNMCLVVPVRQDHSQGHHRQIAWGLVVL